MKLIKYEADWCSSCKAQDAQLDNLTNIDIIHINVDDDPNSAINDNVRSLPTMILKDENDNEIHRFIGVTLQDTIQKFINDND